MFFQGLQGTLLSRMKKPATGGGWSVVPPIGKKALNPPDRACIIHLKFDDTLPLSVPRRWLQRVMVKLLNSSPPALSMEAQHAERQ